MRALVFVALLANNNGFAAVPPPGKPMPREADVPAAPNGDDLNKLSEVVPPVGALDFIHMTEVGSARAALLGPQKQFVTKKCDVFGENRIYFFIGRPDYRKSHWDDETDDITVFPVAFVLDHAKMPIPQYVYPMDTGAAARGYFSTRGVSPHVRLEDFRLRDLIAARRHITRCFIDATRYFSGDLNPATEPKPGDPNWIDTAFQKMARVPAQAANAPDRRASAVEVAYTAHVPLTGRLKLLVLPSAIQDSGYEAFRQAASQLAPSGGGARIEYYDWLPDRKPASFMEEIRGIVERYLVDEGQISC